jgi:drug/metabolite transporter (DMT)-like permease
MKPLALAGIVLAVLGGFIVFRGISYGAEHSVMKVGDLQVSTKDRHTVPAWMGGVALVAGVLMVAAGVGRRRGA